MATASSVEERVIKLKDQIDYWQTKVRTMIIANILVERGRQLGTGDSLGHGRHRKLADKGRVRQTEAGAELSGGVACPTSR